MDSSALLFVALAVAWAVYLVPKALRHHDEVVRSRSVDKFSHTMRVLARREPVDRRNARLVISPVRPSGRPRVETKAHTSLLTAASPTPSPAPAAARVPAGRPVSPAAARAAARRAARRRRNVLAVLVLANVVVVALAATAVLAWPWTAVPGGLLVAWLVACRVSVRAERARKQAPVQLGLPADEAGDAELTGEIGPVAVAPVARGTETSSETSSETSPETRPGTSPESPLAADTPAADAPAVLTGEVPVVAAAGGWDMVPTTLPTYVTKPAAQRRTVSTIDLDSTGVWSSGRHDGDSALARSAEQADKAAAREEEPGQRATGA